LQFQILRRIGRLGSRKTVGGKKGESMCGVWIKPQIVKRGSNKEKGHKAWRANRVVGVKGGWENRTPDKGREQGARKLCEEN